MNELMELIAENDIQQTQVVEQAILNRLDFISLILIIMLLFQVFVLMRGGNK